VIPQDNAAGFSPLVFILSRRMTDLNG